MQVLRGWESHYGRLSPSLAAKFLSHRALNEICEFPSGLVFTLFRRNKKLDDLLTDIKACVNEWNVDEVSFRRSVDPTVEVVREFPLEQDERSYPFNSLGQSSLSFWNDYFFDEDGPFEKTDATLWEDYIFGDGFR